MVSAYCAATSCVPSVLLPSITIYSTYSFLIERIEENVFAISLAAFLTTVTILTNGEVEESILFI